MTNKQMSLKELKEYFDQHPLFRRIRKAIYDDSYLWIVIHGPPRSSKSTLALWILWYIYGDWTQAYSAITFNLQGLMHKIINGVPVRFPTSNGLHKRVPILLYDDFGVHSNKADTQHSSAWDIFKGGFDALGTEIGVLLATMVNAEEPTSQLKDKYNIEITVNKKGRFKYDEVIWLQDYKGFRTKMKKHFIANGFFPKIPDQWYNPYDEMRQNLTKEVFVRIQDAITMDQLDIVLKMIKPSDIQLLELIDMNGPVKYDKAQEELQGLYKQTFTRCKARNLIVTEDYGSRNYKIELTPLAKDVLESLKNKEKSRNKSIYKKERHY